jgi:hypothetical protein
MSCVCERLSRPGNPPPGLGAGFPSKLVIFGACRDLDPKPGIGIHENAQSPGMPYAWWSETSMMASGGTPGEELGLG